MTSNHGTASKRFLRLLSVPMLLTGCAMMMIKARTPARHSQPVYQDFGNQIYFVLTYSALPGWLASQCNGWILYLLKLQHLNVINLVTKSQLCNWLRTFKNQVKVIIQRCDLSRIVLLTVWWRDCGVQFNIFPSGFSDWLPLLSKV